MSVVNLDRSVDLPWAISRGTHNPFTLTFDEDISHLTNWRWNLKVSPDDLEADAVLVLSETNELLTITDTTIAGAFTLAQVNRLRRGTYYYELLYDDEEGNTFAMFRSESFIVQNQNSSSPTSLLSVEVNLGGTTINASVTLAGGSGASTAEDVSFTPSGNIEAEDVQAAIEELDDEKADDAATTEALALKADDNAVWKTSGTIAGVDFVNNITATELNDALKTRRVLYKNNISSSVTGTTSETIVGSVLVPAGTLGANDIVSFNIVCSKSGIAGTLHAKIRVHTSESLQGGPTQLARFLPSATNIYLKMERELIFKNSLSSQVIFNNTTSDESGLGAISNAITTLSNDYSINQYFMITIQLLDGADTGTLESWYVEIIRG